MSVYYRSGWENGCLLAKEGFGTDPRGHVLDYLFDRAANMALIDKLGQQPVGHAAEATMFERRDP
jgi:hypothetical protein